MLYRSMQVGNLFCCPLCLFNLSSLDHATHLDAINPFPLKLFPSTVTFPDFLGASQKNKSMLKVLTATNGYICCTHMRQLIQNTALSTNFKASDYTRTL